MNAYVEGKLSKYAGTTPLWRVLGQSVESRLDSKAERISNETRLNPAEVRQAVRQALARLENEASRIQARIRTRATPESSGVEPRARPWALLGEDENWREIQAAHARRRSPEARSASEPGALVSAYRRQVVAELTPKPLAEPMAPIDADGAFSEASNSVRQIWREFRGYCERSPELDYGWLQGTIQLGHESVASYRDLERRLGALPDAVDIGPLRARSIVLQSSRAEQQILNTLVDDFVLLQFGEAPGHPAYAEVHARFLARLSALADLVRTFKRGVMTSSPEQDGHAILHPRSRVDEHTWIQEKLREALTVYPLSLTQAGAFSPTLRTMVGVLASRLHALPADATPEEVDREAFRAAQAGFYFGVAYGMIDGLLDVDKASDAFSGVSRQRLLDLVDKGLSGTPIRPDELPQHPAARLLHESFAALRALSGPKEAEIFRDLAVLHKAQRADAKPLDHRRTDEEIYVPLILKARNSYGVAAALGGHDLDAGFEGAAGSVNSRGALAQTPSLRRRLSFQAFLGQMTDDIQDFVDDQKAGVLTGFTHYAMHKGGRNAPENPLHLFLKGCQYAHAEGGGGVRLRAALGRRILRAFKFLEQTAGPPGVQSFLDEFSGGDPKLQAVLRNVVATARGVPNPEKDMFHFGIEGRAGSWARVNRRLATYFADHLPTVERMLPIASGSDPEEKLLVDGMNHSLLAGGKRLRPMLTLMSADMFGVPHEVALPFARAIEELHTASLIFDDLPAQDNADLRRNRPTLHKLQDVPAAMAEARAQLSGLGLIADAIAHTAKAPAADPARQLAAIASVGRAMHELSVGQLKDIAAARSGLPEDKVAALEEIGWLKTGKAIEMCLVPPAIIGGESENTIDQLKLLARKLGILYQLKDDILDVEGDSAELGKKAGIDAQNGAQTFVSVLGLEAAKARLSTLHREALEVLDALPVSSGTLREVVDYIVQRTK